MTELAFTAHRFLGGARTLFVPTSYYGVPSAAAAAKLQSLLDLRGLEVPKRPVLRQCLGIVGERRVDLVAAYLAALCRRQGHVDVFSFDLGLTALGLRLLTGAGPEPRADADDGRQA